MREPSCTSGGGQDPVHNDPGPLSVIRARSLVPRMRICAPSEATGGLPTPSVARKHHSRPCLRRALNARMHLVRVLASVIFERPLHRLTHGLAQAGVQLLRRWGWSGIWSVAGSEGLLCKGLASLVEQHQHRIEDRDWRGPAVANDQVSANRLARQKGRARHVDRETQPSVVATRYRRPAGCGRGWDRVDDLAARKLVVQRSDRRNRRRCAIGEALWCTVSSRTTIRVAGRS
jgi:hypothetical protein